MRALIPLATLILTLALSIATSFNAHAVIEVRTFDDPAKQQLYEELIDELRCLVCQNQNLAASNAALAKDLRRQAYEMIQQGADKNKIRDYMTARYGDFVLYRPPVKSTTIALWVGPILLLVIGIAIVVLIARRRAAVEELPEEERQQARKLLED
jgi:cytochrome c-type biogenesis protein CcmH